MDRTNVISEIIAIYKKRLKGKTLFCVLAFVAFIIMMFTATKVGSTGDELLDGGNGKYALKYYISGDTTFTDYSKVPEVIHKHLKYYGVGFEILPTIIVESFGVEKYLYLIRHILNALFGFILILFTGLIAKELRGWGLACLTLVFMLITPTLFGLSFFDSHDIPMTTGYTIAMFAFLRIYRTLPAFWWGDIVLAVIGIAIAVSVRVGGLVLPCYFGLGILLTFIFRKDLRLLLFKKKHHFLVKLLCVCCGIVFTGVILGFCAYPNFFHEGPVAHVVNAFDLVKKFSQRIPMLWNGNIVSSLELPDYYLIKSLLTTIPPYVWFGVFLFILSFRKIFEKYNKIFLIFLVFTALFPPLYVYYTDANIYNGWRHVLFMYPPFAIVSALGVIETYDRISKKLARQAYIAGMVLMILPTAYWMCCNYKYTYAYYNVLIPDPYLMYDMDYHETAAIVAYDWFCDNIADKTDSTIVIGAKNLVTIQYDTLKKQDHIKVVPVSFRNYVESGCDYVILGINFIPKNVLELSFPPRGTIHAECIDGQPVCAVIDRRIRDDYYGIEAIKKGRINEGMALLEQVFRKNPENFGIWFWMGYGYFYQQKYQEAINFFEKYLNFWPDNERIFLSYVLSGESFLRLGKYDEALQVLRIAEKMSIDRNKQYFSQIRCNIGLSYYNKGDFKNAVPYLESVRAQQPVAESVLEDCYMKTRGAVK